MDKKQAISLGMTIFGTIGTTFGFVVFFSPNYQLLLDEISSDLNLATVDCKNLNNLEKTHLQQTLLSAQKALSVENNYSKASSLLNSVSGDLHTCLPTLQLPLGGAELALLTMFLLITAVGIRLFVDDWRKKHSMKKFFVLQVDVSNHTKWLGKDRTDDIKWMKKHDSRKDLAEQIIEILKKYGFTKYLWNGDGGIFFCTADGKQNSDFVVTAVDELFALFEKWKNVYRELETQPLDLRVAIDLEFIIADGKPSFWTSYNLNRFLKDEKTITLRGFAISQTIKDQMNPKLQARFTLKQLVRRFDEIYFYVDSIHNREEKDQN